MQRCDLSHREGIRQVAPNQFAGIDAGYPIDLYGNTYLVLGVQACNPTRSDDDPRDKRIARLMLYKLTKSGDYSKAKGAFCSVYIRVSGKVDNDFRVAAEMTPKTSRAIDTYNTAVRQGRDTRFRRHWAFERSHEDGLSGYEAVERSSTWTGWYG